VKRTKDDNADQETIRQLADALIANFSSRFSLLCGRCWDEARFSRKKGRKWTDASIRIAAAEHFFNLGWRYDRVSLCPVCKHKYLIGP